MELFKKESGKQAPFLINIPNPTVKTVGFFYTVYVN